MGRHATHDVHPNSVIAFAALDLCARNALVLNVYLLAGTPLTDREVAQRLGFQDMNAVRPSITRMVDQEHALLWECGTTKCSVTGRPVRVCMPTKKARGVTP